MNYRCRKWLIVVAIAVLAVVPLHLLRRAFVADSFVSRGFSMEPTVYDGTKVYVNKLKMGARIYTSFDFDSHILKSFRMPGFSDLKVGDLVVANYPYPYSKDTIGFKMNYVYLKRCIGVPGDTLRIVDGYYANSSVAGRIGDAASQSRLSRMSDEDVAAAGFVNNAFQQDKSQRWTIRNFGPLYIPGKGDVVKITPDNVRMWRKMIMFETGFMPQVADTGEILLDGMVLTEYKFRTDWYFLGGDNVLDSRDSRYIGLFPESYIVGIVDIPRIFRN